MTDRKEKEDTENSIFQTFMFWNQSTLNKLAITTVSLNVSQSPALPAIPCPVHKSVNKAGREVEGVGWEGGGDVGGLW